MDIPLSLYLESFGGDVLCLSLESTALALSAWRTPVRGEARLLLSLPAAGLARVVVFDVTGARVATPLDGWREAGRHALAWSTSGAGPGVYFARVRFAGRIATTRFVVLP